jgi:hypothetical protein
VGEAGAEFKPFRSSLKGENRTMEEGCYQQADQEFIQDILLGINLRRANRSRVLEF